MHLTIRPIFKTEKDENAYTSYQSMFVWVITPYIPVPCARRILHGTIML